MPTTARLSDINGWYEVKDNPISKVGVFQYLGKSIPGADPDRVYNVFRSPECLEAAANNGTIRLLPWIDDHVMLGDADKKLTPAEEKGVHGVIGQDIYFKDDTLYANIKVFSEALADLIDAGKTELSLGYRCKYLKESGVWNGQPFDYSQHDIRGNHLASVDEGRMGPDVSVLDSFTFTFDAKDIQQMADPTDTPVAELSLTDAIAAVNSLLPILMKLAGGQSAPVETDPADLPIAAVEGDPNPAVAIDADPAAPADKDKSAIATDEEDPAKKETVAMDAAIKRIDKSLANMTPAAMALAVSAEFSKRDKLAAKLSAHVGVFDHSEMTHAGVVTYGVKALGLTAPKGQEAAYLDGVLSVKRDPAAGRIATGHSYAMDGKDAAKPNFIQKHIAGKE